jgi:hypothetical protein
MGYLATANYPAATIVSHWATVRTWCDVHHVNGPCVQLKYPGHDGATTSIQQYINYLQEVAPYCPAGTYQISCNEVLNTAHHENGDDLLTLLGGPGVTGYDGLIALIKLQRQYLPTGVLLGLNEFDVCSWDTGIPPNTYLLQEALNVYNILAQNGAALDWLGCEGYYGSFQPGSGTSVSQYDTAINSVGSQLVTTRGVGASGTIAFTEFTPGNGGDFASASQPQESCWQAFLGMFATNQYVFGVTGPWEAFRRSDQFNPGSWFYDDTTNGGTDPDDAATSNGHVTATLTWLQGWVPGNIHN